MTNDEIIELLDTFEEALIFYEDEVNNEFGSFDAMVKARVEMQNAKQSLLDVILK